MSFVLHFAGVGQKMGQRIVETKGVTRFVVWENRGTWDKWDHLVNSEQ